MIFAKSSGVAKTASLYSSFSSKTISALYLSSIPSEGIDGSTLTTGPAGSVVGEGLGLGLGVTVGVA